MDIERLNALQHPDLPQFKFSRRSDGSLMCEVGPHVWTVGLPAGNTVSGAQYAFMCVMSMQCDPHEMFYARRVAERFNEVD